MSLVVRGVSSLLRGQLLLQHALNILSSPSRINSAEQDIHILKTASLGLLDEEEGEDTHGQTENTKHQERPPSDVVDGSWCDLGDNEVEEPLCRCGQTNTVGSETGGEDLGNVDPWNRTPRGGVSDNEEVNHSNHCDGGR